MCNHEVCRNHPAVTGVAAVIVNTYNRYDKYGNLVSSFPVVMLGMERFGTYAGSYNFSAGKIEPGDKKCILRALMRELMEEFKINLNWKSFNYHFLHNGKLRYIMHRNTPVFIGKFRGLSRQPLNAAIAQSNRNPLAPQQEKEMQCVDWFYLPSLGNIDNKPCTASSFVGGFLANNRNMNTLISLC